MVMSVWSDRLAEVWASPGRAGAGVVVGDRGVLTARHVVEDALDTEGSRVLARVVRPGALVGAWVPMRVAWDDSEWDVALLAVDVTVSEADRWLVPNSPPVVVVVLETDAEPGCEAVGFPQSAIERPPDAESSSVRQTEQVVGTILPGSQGKPPVNPERALRPGRWMPLDVTTATPGTQAGWGGMSGAGVILPDGRLIGVVVTAEAEHQQRRLYLVPLAPLLERAAGFAEAWAERTGRRETAQARNAALWTTLLDARCVGQDGVPAPIGVLEDLGAFGVKVADVPGEPPYLHYVPRDDDRELRAALDRAVHERRMLLVVGMSAAGKSRSAAEAVRNRLPDHRLVRPDPGKLADLANAPLAELRPAVVWLDDVETYAHVAFRSTLARLVDAGVLVVGTIRQAQMKELDKPGDVRDPTGDALSDQTLVERQMWQAAWSPAERARTADHVSSDELLTAVANDTPLGAYCVAGPKLVQRLKDARADEENPWGFALVRTVLDWYRTGITDPMPTGEARRLAAILLNADNGLEPDELDEAFNWATTPEFKAPRGTRRQALLTEDPRAKTLTIHDYVLDHDQRTTAPDVPDRVWESALNYPTEEQRFTIGVTAARAGKTHHSAAAFEPLAEAGNTGAMFNLGVLVAEGEPEVARRWYEQAAEAGNTKAMNNLGVLVEEGEPEAARRWYEQAAEAGDTGAMNNLGLLVEEGEPGVARRWFEQAAEAGNTDAMFNLGVLVDEGEPEAARRWYEQAAEAGNTDAMVNLGVLVAEGEPEVARRWYERAAEAGDTDAMVNLGVLLEEGEPEVARHWYERAAEAGNTTAMVNLGLLVAEGEPEVARHWYERAAQAGNTTAMVNLGLLVAEGEPEVARRWYERAAEAGSTDAMVNLGVLVAEGEPGVARHWYERAAEAGSTDAMVNLGVLVAEGEPGVARHWYERAAEAGSTDAMVNLGVLLEEGEPEVARHWYERAAEAGNTNAMVNLGVLVEEGEPEVARRWYERAAEAGNTDAMNNLGVLLEEGEPQVARHWYERAAEAGNTNAMNNLGVLVEEGEPEVARHWYERAAEAGNTNAMNNLGVLLEEGEPQVARHWYEQAAQAGNTDAMNNLGVLLEEGEPQVARHWYEQAAQAGNTDAMNNLGVLLEEGEPQVARHWYEQAAQAGNTDAMNNLGKLLEEREPELARQWLARAADR